MTHRLSGTIALCLALLSASALMSCGLFAQVAPTATPAPTATMPAPSPAVAVSPSAAPVPSATAMPPATNTPLPSSTFPPPPTATATTVATAVRTASPATPAVRAGTPATTAVATVTAPPAVGMTVTEPQGLCTVTLPAGFAATATAGTYAGPGGGAVVSLTALQASPDDTLDDVALPFVGGFVASVEGYQQTGVAREADNLRVDFTGRFGQPGKGTLYLRQFGPTVCALTFFVIEGTEINYEPTLAQLIASLRPVKGVG